MTDEALETAYPQKRGELRFEAARFSPDGALLAVVLSNILSGDPEQVWLYEVRTGVLKPITETPAPRDSMRIEDMAWSDNATLYISAQRIVNSVGRRVFVSATLGGVKQVDKLPPKIDEIFEERAKRFNLNYFDERNDRYAVRSMNAGHGSHALLMQPVGSRTWTQIASGGGELASFVFDPIRSRVLYWAPGRIMAFDLQTRQYETILSLKTSWTLSRLLDQTQDGRLVAYIEADTCLSKVRAFDPSSLGPPHRICFVKLK